MLAWVLEVRMIRPIACLFLPVLAVGCALTPPGALTGMPPGASAIAFSDLIFGAPSLDAVRTLHQAPPALLASPAPAYPASPLAPMVPFAQSGEVGTPASYSLDALLGRSEAITIVSDVRLRRALTGFEEAFLPGFSGTFQALQERLKPIVATWAPDAQLVRSNVTPEELRGEGPPPPAICVYPNYGPPWDLVYASIAKQEVLRFRVAGHRIEVLKLSWATPGRDMPPPPIAPDGSPVAWPPVSREIAVEKLKTALRTPGAISVEERNRWNYFHGTPHAEPSYYPDTAPPNLVAGPIYELGADLGWDASLQSILGRQVWVLHATSVDPPALSLSSGGFRVMCTTAPGMPRLRVVGDAYGLVDAETGDVIRFARPAQRIDRTPTL
jgi:hypothetical protein